MSELAISASINVGRHLSELFDTVRGFRPGDPQLHLVSGLRKAEVNCNGTIFSKGEHLKS